MELETLRALAAGVALDASLELVAGPPGGGWAIDAHAGRIHVDPLDLERLPETELYGLTCHEAAHAAVTRYFWLVPRQILQEPGVALLLNALEDCRIEAWLARRLPGAAPWIAAYNDRLFPQDATLAGREPFLQFCLAAVHAWWHGELPAGLHPEVVRALGQTAEARREVVAASPPVQPDVPWSARYEASRVAGSFARHDRGARVEGFEQEVRLAAAQAWQIVWAQILQPYRALVALTPPEQVRALERTELLRVTARLLSGPPVGRQPLREAPPIDAERLQAATAPEPVEGWDEALREVLPVADALVEALARILRPRELPRWIPGHWSGLSVDLRALMQLEARPDRLDVWRRKTLPDRPDPGFVVALDLSGSMAGEGIQHAFRGVVAVSEALERLQLPFAIWGFQDEPIPFKPFERPLALAKDALNTMPLEILGARPGGRNRPEHNWDGPVIRRLAEDLVGRFRTPVLLVVSDGAPSGPGDAVEHLARAVREVGALVHLVGVGLGPGAAHVADLYPRAVATSVEHAPTALARCLQEALYAR